LGFLKNKYTAIDKGIMLPASIPYNKGLHSSGLQGEKLIKTKNAVIEKATYEIIAVAIQRNTLTPVFFAS